MLGAGAGAARERPAATPRSRPAPCASPIDGVDDLRALVPDLTDAEVATTDFGTYPEARVLRRHGPGHRVPLPTPTWPRLLVTGATPPCAGCATRACGSPPTYGRQAYQVDGRFMLLGRADRRGVGRRAGPGRGAAPTVAATGGHRDPLRRPRHRPDRRRRRRARRAGPASTGDRRRCAADAVVLAARRLPGQRRVAHPVPRARLGPGQGARHPLQHRRRHPHGPGGRGVARRPLVRLPRGGLGPQRARVRRPRGRRRLPEAQLSARDHGQRRAASASSTRAPTSATTPTPSTAGAILAQPGQFAWQVFDAKVAHLLRDEYRIRQVTKVTADTLEELAGKLEGVDAGARSCDTVGRTTRRSAADVPFDPNVKDGRGTDGLAIPKSNWANPLDDAAVRGLRGDLRHHLHLRRAADRRRRPGARRGRPGHSRPVRRGEMVGGLFYFNYPGGSGLTAGSVFGRAAGRHAASS